MGPILVAKIIPATRNVGYEICWYCIENQSIIEHRNSHLYGKHFAMEKSEGKNAFIHKSILM